MNLADLKKRIEKSREFTIPWENFRLIVRRPTSEQVYAMRPKDAEDPRDQYHSMVDHYKCIVGWEGVTEEHLLDGANGVAVSYDFELLPELLDRHPGLSNKIIESLYTEWTTHAEREAEEKKP